MFLFSFIYCDRRSHDKAILQIEKTDLTGLHCCRMKSDYLDKKVFINDSCVINLHIGLLTQLRDPDVNTGDITFCKVL